MNIHYLIKEGFLHPTRLIEAILRKKAIARFINDKTAIELFYYLRFRKFPNLKFPSTFNEKLLWLTLHDRRPIYNRMVDKYEAKDYIQTILKRQGIPDNVIIPTYGIYDRFDDIDFSQLPNQFVIKTTHDSGSVIIVKDKTKLDINKARQIISKSMANNYYWFSREWVYKDVKPRIIIEQLLVPSNSEDLRDYKFFCFNGEPYYVKVDFDRFKDHHANYFDITWNLQKWGEIICPPIFNKELPPPNNLVFMKSIAAILSKGMPFLRVDFYEVNNRVYIGELTLYPAGGLGRFTSHNADMMLGKFIDIRLNER